MQDKRRLTYDILLTDRHAMIMTTVDELWVKVNCCG
jgi:hypothetical protein